MINIKIRYISRKNLDIFNFIAAEKASETNYISFYTYAYKSFQLISCHTYIQVLCIMCENMFYCMKKCIRSHESEVS